jgi:hypothetical protein
MCIKANNLLSKMIQINPKKRINAATALKHEYFDGF